LVCAFERLRSSNLPSKELSTPNAPL